MGIEILYLDSSKDKVVGRALKKHGKVRRAWDFNDSVELIAEKEFDYFFLDADFPCIRELLTHLEHDPYFIPPKAFVLLTNNEVEDCHAWNVDTYITRRRIKEDLPFVFSHHKGEPSNNSGVLKLIPGDGEQSEARTEARREYSDLEDVTDTGIIDEENDGHKSQEPAPERQLGISALSRFDGTEKFEHRESGRIEKPSTSNDLGEANEEPEVKKPEKESVFAFSRDDNRRKTPEQIGISANGVTPDRNDNRRKLTSKVPFKQSRVKLIWVGLAAIALCVLLYTAAPLGFKGPGKKTNSGSEAEAIDEGSGRGENRESPVDLVFDDVRDASGDSAQSSVPAADNMEAVKSAVQELPVEAAPQESSMSSPPAYSSPAPAPAPQPAANNQPSVSISGPAQVYVRQTATYTAVASDPDGDSISYSWGSSARSMAWSTPGQYTVSVTVTDSRGASRSASLSVRVI